MQASTTITYFEPGIAGGAATMRGVIDRLAQDRSTATFLVCPTTGETMTFAQLQMRGRFLGDTLARLGLTKGDTVALLLSNSIYTAELFLSIMYCGFVAVPLNLAAGSSSIAQAILDSDPQAIFTSSEHFELLSSLNDPSLKLERSMVEYDQQSKICYIPRPRGTTPGAPVPAADIHPQDDALIAYTSGSTGVPKGSVFSHHNLLVGGLNTAVAHELTTADCSLCVLPLYHMNAQIVTLMSTMITGGCVVVPSHFNPNLFWPHLREFNCTWFALVPTIVTQLLECTKLTPAQISRLRDHVRFARSSSAPLSRTANEHFERQFGLPMIEAMGMTEAGGAIFSNPLPPHQRKVGSPGIPYGFEVRVIDADGYPLPRGQEGEILIKGESVMKRYHKQPPGAAVPVDGFLSTGDLGWQDEDGFIFIAGRKSELINKGGEKFTPREVEELLLKQPSVIEAAVVGVPDPNLGQDAVAFVVLRGDDAEDSLRELSDVCETQLGSVKSPGHFVVLPELPKGTAHKTDRKKLREFWAAGKAPAAVSASALRRANDDRHVPTQTTVLQAMAEVLSYPEIAPTDNFFDLGGYSLRGLQLINKLSRSFGMRIPVSALFQGPTAEKLSAFIDNQLSGTNSPQPQKSSIASMVPIKISGSRKPLFLTPGGNGSDEEFLVYARLASYFGAEQPLYGLKARSSMTGVAPHATVEQMAKDYLEEVRQLQPQGPYYLLGECTGGVIAFEMARQLRKMGEPVALLVLLDAQAPDRLHYTWRRLGWFWSSVTRKITELLGGADSAGPTTEANQAAVVEDLDRNRRERDAKWIAYKRPLLQYCPEKYDGKLVLIYSPEYYAKGVHNTWRSVRTKETQILTVEGNHYEYIRECAKSTGATIVGLIDTADDGAVMSVPACQLTR